MADLKSLDALNSARQPRRPQAAAPVHVQKLRRPGPRLCHRQAQERGRPRLDQARHRQDHRQRQGICAAYFARPVLQMILRQPFIAANRDGQFDVIATVAGGGLSGQAGAVRHGISKALHLLRARRCARVLKKGGFLTRDSRVVERKKYGKAKARRSFQFSKR